MNVSNIQKSQGQYFDLLKSYEEEVFSDNVNQKNIAMIIDEIQCFWLNKKDVLAFELDTLSSKKECFVLSGAVYLDIKDNEHYIFKALGNEHIISDPLLKLENFFRLPSQVFDKSSIELFRRAFRDVFEILSKYQNNFYILPINIIAIENQEEHMELLQKFFLNFINTMLDENFDSIDDFFEKYLTYEDIENNMTLFFKSNLTFNDSNDEALSLKDKVESHINNQPVMTLVFQDKTETEKFIASLYGLVSQIMDILLISSITNTTPFIRFKPTFHYLTTVMYTFIEDEYFKIMIEKTMIYYIFYYTVDKEKLMKIDFSTYTNIVKETDFLNLIIQEMKKNNINIFESGVESVGKIIEQEFCNTIKRYNKT
ncbi:MAG TPA: hypothetical protein EYG89_03345 [Bacteroidia bacterium]|nr:hypothetical protein [Bacteroidia bacterium]